MNKLDFNWHYKLYYIIKTFGYMGNNLENCQRCNYKPPESTRQNTQTQNILVNQVTPEQSNIQQAKIANQMT